MSREVIANINRQEKLLLDLIYERVLANKPEPPDTIGEPPSDHYKGYCEGWWDCLEALGNAMAQQQESNDAEMERWKR